MRYLLASICALSLSTAFAAKVPDSAAVLGPGVNAPAYKLTAPKEATWPARLAGEWRGQANEAGVISGVMLLNPDRTMELRPTGMYVLKGYWYALAPNKLEFDTPLQKVEATYALDGHTLVLTYSNGLQQTFNSAKRALKK